MFILSNKIIYSNKYDYNFDYWTFDQHICSESKEIKRETENIITV